MLVGGQVEFLLEATVARWIWGLLCAGEEVIAASETHYVFRRVRKIAKSDY
jgi:hypothetical protein